MDFGFTSVAAITVICYLVIEIIKTTQLNRKWLPVISGLLGGALGILAMYIMPSYPAADALNAIPSASSADWPRPASIKLRNSSSALPDRPRPRNRLQPFCTALPAFLCRQGGFPCSSGTSAARPADGRR
jgi:cytochrome c biogenesis protein CcdA